MLPQPIVRYGRELVLVNHISRQSRREGTLKQVTPSAVPKKLIENALVVSSVKAVVAVQRQQQAQHKKGGRHLNHHPQRLIFLPSQKYHLPAVMKLSDNSINLK